jgi:hypothetical protein
MILLLANQSRASAIQVRAKALNIKADLLFAKASQMGISPEAALNIVEASSILQASGPTKPLAPEKTKRLTSLALQLNSEPPQIKPNMPGTGGAKPVYRGYYEAVNPRTGEETARDIEIWRVEDMPPAMKQRVAQNLRKHYPLVYGNGLTDAQILAKVRTENTYMFVVFDRSQPGEIATAAFTLNQGNRGETLTGYAYLGNYVALGVPGAGSILTDAAKYVLPQFGIHSFAYVTTDIEGNASTYLARGAQLTLKDFDGTRKLNMYQSFETPPFNINGGVAYDLPAGTSLKTTTPADFYNRFVKRHLEAGKTVRLEFAADGKTPLRIWVYDSETAAGQYKTN